MPKRRDSPSLIVVKLVMSRAAFSCATPSRSVAQLARRSPSRQYLPSMTPTPLGPKVTRFLSRNSAVGRVLVQKSACSYLFAVL